MKLVATLVASMLLLASTAGALEKTREAFDDERTNWNAGATCTIVYYNTCTGWVFNWGGWESDDQIGVVAETCCPGGSELLSNEIYFRDPAPSGYGFTGSVSVWAADDNDCPSGAALASVPFLPEAQGWETFNWGLSVPSKFVVTLEFGPAASNPARVRTDHPSAGPTGPEACGTCYPSTRQSHSYYYGTIASPLCPGSGFDDDASNCDAELLFTFTMACTVPVEQQSWGKVKTLYR
jgi:hypothetical protein